MSEINDFQTVGLPNSAQEAAPGVVLKSPETQRRPITPLGVNRPNLPTTPPESPSANSVAGDNEGVQRAEAPNVPAIRVENHEAGHVSVEAEDVGNETVPVLNLLGCGGNVGPDVGTNRNAALGLFGRIVAWFNRLQAKARKMMF